MSKSLKKPQQSPAEKEYKRLLDLFKKANVDAVKLDFYDNLLRKVAEQYGILEALKDLPTVLFDPENPKNQKETAAGKARTKVFAQYMSAMQKLSKDLLGQLDSDGDDDDLDKYR